MARALSQRRENLLYEQSVTMTDLGRSCESRMASYAEFNSQRLKDLRIETRQHANELESVKEIRSLAIPELEFTNAEELFRIEECMRMELADAECMSFAHVEVYRRDMEAAVDRELEIMRSGFEKHFNILDMVQKKFLSDFRKIYVSRIQQNTDEGLNLNEQLISVRKKGIEIQENTDILKEENKAIAIAVKDYEERKTIILVKEESISRDKEAYLNYIHANKMLEQKLFELKSAIHAYQ